MNLLDRCPVCGGEVVAKNIRKLLEGGNHTAIMKAEAEVCLRCGGRFYSDETVQRFEEIRAKLDRQETAGLQKVGLSFQVIQP